MTKPQIMFKLLREIKNLVLYTLNLTIQPYGTNTV